MNFIEFKYFEWFEWFEWLEYYERFCHIIGMIVLKYEEIKSFKQID